MLLSKRPTQNAIVLWELARAGERGLSSYRAYDPMFQVKRLAARIDDLENKYGCVIEHRGTHPAIYTLKEVTPETCAIFYKQNPMLDKLLDHYVRVDLTDVGKLTPLEAKIAEKEGKLIRRFEGSRTWLERTKL